MQRKLPLLLVLGAITAIPWLWAQSSMAPSGLLGSQPQVGVIAAVRGVVEIASAEKIGRVVQSGAAVFLGDEVSTGPEGQLQILLMDESVFTVGANSSVVIDTFIYDPDTLDGKVHAKILKGSFRAATGLIGKKEPKNVEIELPAGSVGIRGTIFAGEVEGERSTLLLLGPGEHNMTGHRAGAIDVRNEVNGVRVGELVEKAGYGSIIEGRNIPPTPAFHFSVDQIQQIISPLMIQEDPSEASHTPSSAAPPSGAVRDDNGPVDRPDPAQSGGDALTAKGPVPMGRTLQGTSVPSSQAIQQAMQMPVDSSSQMMEESMRAMEKAAEHVFQGGLGGEESFRMDMSKGPELMMQRNIEQLKTFEAMTQMTYQLQRELQESTQDQAEQMTSIEYQMSQIQSQYSASPSASPSVSGS